MAKSKTSRSGSEHRPMTDEASMSASNSAGGGDMNVSRYFKQLFQSRPELLQERSNEAIYAIWLADHPGHREVPKNIQQGLSNIKSVMRRETGSPVRGKRGRKPKGYHWGNSENGTISTSSSRGVRTSTRDLETLEVQIDESLSLARKIGTAALELAINHLRMARIQVGLKLGL
jgi:hypothetical protein